MTRGIALIYSVQGIKKVGFNGSHGIEPTRNRTHFLKIGFVVAGGGFYSYYNLQITMY